jgi:ABC-type transport system involved in multi-copper enzyme maturation permease subunit
VIDRVLAIALTTFREAIRRRVLYGILVVVFLFNIFAVVLGEMSLHQEARVARDVGLAGVSFFGSVTAILLGVTLLYNELQRRTIHTIISKPVHRFEFVIGKYLGMAVTLTLLTSLFALALWGVLAIRGVPFGAAVSKAVILAYVEVLVVAAIAIFFSSFSTPFLSGIFTFAIFWVGRVTPEMRQAVETTDTAWIRTVCEIALYVVPDIHLFGVSGGRVPGESEPVSVHGDFVDWSYVGIAGGYGLAYVAIFLVAACFIFSRRDFT